MGLNGGSGIEIIRYAMKAVPGLPVIVVTDSPSLDCAMQAVELPVVAYLPKSTPFSTVHTKIQTALANSDGRRAAARIQRLLRRCADDLDIGLFGESGAPGGKRLLLSPGAAFNAADAGWMSGGTRCIGDGSVS